MSQDLLGMDARDAPARREGTDGPDGLDGAQGSGGAAARWWRRNRSLVAVGAVLVLGIVLVVAGVPRGVEDPLSPTSAAPDGARAVAQVLQRQGVDVRPQSGFDAVVAEAGPGTTALLLDGQVLEPARLRELRATGADLVLVEPTLPVLRVLAPEVTIAGFARDYTAAPGCEDADALAAVEARAGSSRYVPSDGTSVPGVEGEAPSPSARVEVCYGDGTRDDAGSYVSVVDETQDRRVVVHGQPALLTNEYLAQEGNAALALRSLGHHDVLHWYRVDPFDVALGTREGEPPSSVDLLPRWVGWAVAQLLLVLVVVLLWRGRRLGRLVPERLPAVVRSVETTEGRARLYRGAGARGAAADTLRRASLQRLSARLGGARSADPAAVARMAAQHSGRDPVAVQALLTGPEPRDDAALVRLADDLDALEREVTRT